MTMIKSKSLSDAGWKDVVAKNKVKDNGLLRVLAELKKCGEDDHDDASKLLDEVLKLAGQLKKDKAIASVPAVSKHIAELLSAAESTVRDVVKAKAEGEKKTKLEADKKAKAEANKKDDDEDEDDEESPELLTTKLKPLLRMVAKGDIMHALVAKSGKQVVVMLSRRPIAPARRKMLADQLGGGSTKFFPGHCSLEAGATTFVLKAEVAGMAKLIKLALLQQTGLRLSKVKCRGEDGDDDDEDGDDVLLDAIAPEEDQKEPDRGGDGIPAEAQKAALAAAPALWEGTRELLENNIEALKKAIQAQCEGEAPGFIAEIKGHLEKIDRVLGKLDRSLGDALAKAGETDDPDTRNGALQRAKAILGETMRYVRSEPLIEHIDRNPFGVPTYLKATLAGSLAHLAKTIG